MTEGADGKTIDGMGMNRINGLIAQMKTTAISQNQHAEPTSKRKTVNCAHWAYRQLMTSWYRKSSE